MRFSERSFLLLITPVLVALAVFLFWGAVYLGHGKIPTIHEIVITDFFVITLPFEVSRLWDMLTGLFFTTPLIFVLMSKKNKDSVISTGILSLVFFLGLIIGITYGVFFLIEFGVITAMVIFVLFNLLAGSILGLNSGIVASLGSGMGLSLSAGIVTGLFFVLAMVVASLCGAGIYAIIKEVKRKRLAR